jgi:hypothetical protein
MYDTAILGAAVMASLAAIGALVGYGALKQKVDALEGWRVRQEIEDSVRDREIQDLIKVAATTTANVNSLTENVNRLLPALRRNR